MTVHVAGLPIRVGNQKRQLCAWCGHVLMDVDVANCDSMDGSEPPHFAPNELVRVNGGVTSIMSHVDGAKVPAGWCGDEGKPRLTVVPREEQG